MAISRRPRDLETDTSFTLRTLGSAALFRSAANGALDEPIPLVGKQFALLAYLACADERGAHRATLFPLFAPRGTPHDDSNAEVKAGDAVRHLIQQLRSRLGPDSLGAPRSDPVRLSVPIRCDRDDLLAAWERRDYRGVAASYAGTFLPRLEGVATPDFAVWVEHERAVLGKRFAQAARHTIANDIAAAPDPDALRRALHLARRLRDHEPLAQDAWQFVLRCLILCGEHEDAALEAQQLHALLGEHGMDVEPATRSLLNLARAEASRALAINAAEPPPKATPERLVGRTAQVATILAAWDRARAADGALVHLHVTAGAGFGKSGLLADIRQRLRARPSNRGGTRAVEVRSSQSSRDVAYSFAADIARTLAERPGGISVSEWTAGVLVGLNPALASVYRNTNPSPGVSAGERHRPIAGALQELFAAVALEGPICLLLDDLHWCDAESLGVLAECCGACRDLPVLVVSASRDSCPALSGIAGTQQIELGPLDAAGVGELLTRIAPLPREPWADRLPQALWEATGGSPLLVVETVKLLTEQSLATVTPAGWQVRDAAALFGALDDGSVTRHRLDRLSPPERWLLLLLAVSGAPLSASRLRSAAAQSVAEFNASLTALERRGLAVRQSDEWTVAHDTHARAALDTAEPAATEAANAAVGRAIVDDAGHDVRDFRRGGSLLSRGGDRAETERTFERYVRLSRARGDARPPLPLAREWVGNDNDAARRLVRSLPWRVRAGLHTRGRLTAAIAAGGLLLAILAVIPLVGARPTPPAPDAILVAQRYSADNRTFEYFPRSLDVSHWAGTSVLDMLSNDRPRWRTPIRSGIGVMTSRPDGRGWTATITASDTGGIDLFDIALDGTERRLTWVRGDDFGASWAPDNARFAFVTSRWSQRGHYDIAIYDTLTRTVTQLTQGADTDGVPQWSPDGSRIAFVRMYDDGSGYTWCVIDADGGHLSCRPLTSGASSGVTGWIDAHRVLMTRTVGALQTLETFDLARNAGEVIDTVLNVTSISPNGKFVLCQCARRGYPPETYIVYPLERPHDFAVVRASDDSTRIALQWAPTTRRSPYLASLRILSGIGPPVVGTPYQFRASGADTAGRTIPVGVVRWQSGDTTLATIDSTGRLTPRRTGQVTIAASAGGWRDTRTTVTIAAPNNRVQLDEDWTHGLEPTWVTHGDPKPRLLASTVVGPAFLNNGDGYFFSGAYTTRAFPTSGGLWMEARMSAPINAGESQEWKLLMIEITDPAGWAAWDHVTGDAPMARPAPSWGLRYPAGIGGVHFGEQLHVLSPAGETLVRVPAYLRTGRPFQLIMQLFPDGRVGIAIDGKPLWVGTGDFFAPTVHMWLAGNSVDTQMLIGPLRVVAGIAAVAWEPGAASPLRSRTAAPDR